MKYTSLSFYTFVSFICFAFIGCKTSQQATVQTPSEGNEIEVTTNQYSIVTDQGDVYDFLEQQKTEVPEWVSQEGDYNPEQPRLFNLMNTKLRVSFNWEKEQMPGIANLTLSPLFYAQDSVVIDAKGFDIQRIAKVSYADTVTLNYQYDSLLLNISLDKTYTRDDTLQLEIHYTAKPTQLPQQGSAAITAEQGLYFINADGSDPNKPKQIWTQGETESSSCWFPTFDAPNVKTRQELFITVDSAYTTISNGKLVSQQLNTDGTRTDYWKMEQPHTPYLFAMAIGKYAKVTDTWSGKEVSYYVEPKYEKYARQIFGNTPEMLQFFSDKLDYPYPWHKYSQVVVRDFVSGAMENTTVSIFMEDLQVDDRYLIDENWDYIIAHELFHHWFGNLVTCESWANLPLNESFATYSEYLWDEYKYGKNVADLTWKEKLNAYLTESEIKQEPLIRYRYLDKEEMFDNHSYAKGSLILHLLRNYVGDKAFFKALNRYLTTHAYEATEIHDLRQAFEEITGQDWNWFFEQWFMKPGHPNLYVQEYFANDTLSVTISQQQDDRYTPIYRLPLTLDIWGNGKKIRKEVVLEEKVQTFNFIMDSEPDLVLVDPEALMPGIIDHIKSTEAFIAQSQEYKNILVRLDALEQLSTGLDEVAILPVMLAALSDTEPAVRELAAKSFENYEGIQLENVKTSLQALALNDENSMVRGTALNSLSSLGEYPEVIKKALNDSSYVVNAYAIYALGKLKKDAALPEIEPFEAIDNLNVQSTVADFYSYYNVANKYEWFINRVKTVRQGEKPIYINYLGSYLMNQPVEQQKSGVDFLGNLAKESKVVGIRMAAYQALSLLTDVEGVNTLLQSLRDNEQNEELKQYFEMMGN